MVCLSVSQLHKSFGENQVIRPISFEIRKGERVGLIGRNGSGKTTLFGLLTGRLEPDGGERYLDPAQRVEVLDQIPVYPPGTTVRQVLWSAFSHLTALEGQMQALHKALERDGSAANLRRYDALQADYERMGGYEQDLRYNRTLRGMGIEDAFTARLFEELSGGEKTKVNLSRIIISEPDLLLLDEPTNHLDMTSIEWFEEFLYQYPGTVLSISHDRVFLDRTVSRILELEFGQLRDYRGNYSDYMDYKEQLTQELEHRHEQEQKEIRRLEVISTKLLGWGIQTERLSRAALSMRKRVERLRENQTQLLTRNNRRIRASLGEAARSGLDVLTIKDLAAGYDGTLFEGVNLTLKRGERVALLGDNGTGKTTLFKLLLGEKKPLAGRITFVANVQTGLMPQQIVFDHPQRNLVDTLLYSFPITAQIARNRLASYDFVGEEVFKRVADLSGGERARLKHCLLSFEPINLFLLDEPTNHLDIASCEWVESVLEEFEGTMLFISHDRYFISRFADRILTVEHGAITDFAGGFEAYQAARTQAGTRVAAVQPKPGERDRERRERARSPLQAERALQRRLQRAEDMLASAEAKLADLARQINEASTDYERLEELTEKQVAQQEKVDALFLEWSALAEEVGAP